MTLHAAAALLREQNVAAEICGADPEHRHLRFSGVSTDSRSIEHGDLFVALVGDKFDGHGFLDQARSKGAAAALVSREAAAGGDASDSDTLPQLPQLLVPDTRRALGALACGWRQGFDIPVVAVTGSNGKTTTKEMIASILARAYGEENRLATVGNLNNDIGLPLTLLRLRTHHRAAVVELGMNHPGETEALADMARPTVALVNNAQREHLEFMQSVEMVAEEHALAIHALPADGVAVFPADDPHAPLWRKAARLGGHARGIVDFALVASSAGHERQPGDPLVIAQAHLEADGAVVHLDTPLDTTTVKLHVSGLHNVRNAAAATAAAVAIGVPLDAIHNGLEDFVPVKGRMQHRAAAGGVHLIDDSYNANPDSVRAAIDVLAGCAAPALLILGDMGEVGEGGPQFHAEIGAYARDRGLAGFFATGPLMREAVAAFGPGARHFDRIEDLIAAAREAAERLDHRSVLVKGSRFMRMERVVDALGEAHPAGSSTAGQH